MTEVLIYGSYGTRAQEQRIFAEIGFVYIDSKGLCVPSLCGQKVGNYSLEGVKYWLNIFEGLFQEMFQIQAE